VNHNISPKRQAPEPTIHPKQALRVTCHRCSKDYVLTVRTSEYQAWMDGALLQDAMPSLNRTKRKLLVDGVCMDCYDH
jgi:hypothetical protein